MPPWRGASVLRPGEADDIVIAGVSGVTVCGMLEQAPEAFYAAKPDMRFIFIPATKHPFLRRWLAQHGFTLLDETPVLAAGRYYTVMHAAYTGGTKTPRSSVVRRGPCRARTACGRLSCPGGHAS